MHNKPHQHHDELAALRARGHRLTPQRILILDTIKAAGGHLTAEQIHLQVAARLPALNVATIYRTLQWLHEAGMISATDVGEGSLIYEYRAGNPHHHLICEQCRQVIEIDHEVMVALEAELHTRYGFSAQLEHLAIFGRCSGCQQH